jgi:hypothetical protein
MFSFIVDLQFISQQFGVNWVIPKGFYELLSICLKCVGRGKKAKVLWSCRMQLFFGSFFQEQNRRIFEDFPGLCVEELWNGVCFWSALWATVTFMLRNYSLSALLLDWKVAVK